MFESQSFYSRSRHKASGHQSEKRILVLGAGMVSAPLVEYLHRDSPRVAIKVCEYFTSRISYTRSVN